jgi:hypothetical protein
MNTIETTKAMIKAHNEAKQRYHEAMAQYDAELQANNVSRQTAINARYADDAYNRNQDTTIQLLSDLLALVENK